MNINPKYQINSIDSFLESFFTGSLRNENNISEIKSSKWLDSYEGPTIKAFEVENELTLEILVPGWSKKELELGFTERVFTLLGHSKKKAEESSTTNKPRLDLKVQIPTDWNINNARAKLLDGILRISIPRKEIKPRKVIKIS